MEIYVLRHGQAEPREQGKPDADRKLTAKGKRDVRNVLTLARKAKAAPQVIYTSPLRRAQETAAVAAEVFPDCPIVTTRRLLPSASPAALGKEIAADPNVSRVLLVGHSPHLEAVIAHLLQAPVAIDLKKGALVSLTGGTLQWIITPRLARACH